MPAVILTGDRIDFDGNAMHPLVAIVILNWNNASDTLACLESVFRMDYPQFHVLVVDNHSTDDSVARIRERFPVIDLLVTGENLGYAGGNNAGIERALTSDAAYVCVLNNDTVVEPAFLSVLVGAMERDRRIGLAGPLMYYFEPPALIFSAGCAIDWRGGIVHHQGMGLTLSDEAAVPYRHSDAVDAIAGCGFLVSREAIGDVGLLDASYFLNFEDIDWCVRMTNSGYRVAYVPEAVLYHKVSATIGPDSPGNTYYMTRNALHFFARHGPNRTLKPAYADEKYKRHRRAALRAVGDFLRGKTGPAAPV